MRRWLAIAATVGLLLLTAAPAGAAQPFIEHFEDNNQGNPDVFTDACGPGLDLIGVFDVKGTFKVFYDREGDPERLQIHVDFVGTLTRSDTGNAITDPGHFTVTVDLEEGTTTYNGLVFAMTYPGSGIIVQDTGKIVFGPDGAIEFVAGPHEVAFGTDPFAEACAVLG